MAYLKEPSRHSPVDSRKKRREPQPEKFATRLRFEPGTSRTQVYVNLLSHRCSFKGCIGMKDQELDPLAHIICVMSVGSTLSEQAKYPGFRG